MSPKTKKKKDGGKSLAKIEAALEDERKKAEKYLNQLKYARADLENLQKRVQKSIDDAKERANSRLLMQLLPILDELELAINVAKDFENKNLLEGVVMIKGKLEKLMTTEGVIPIEAVGKQFNPNFHEAVLEEETPKHPNGQIIEEFRKGYLYKNRVLRPSMVKVARNMSSDKDNGEDKIE
jgi:molecular chaperone GrpE